MCVFVNILFDVPRFFLLVLVTFLLRFRYCTFCKDNIMVCIPDGPWVIVWTWLCLVNIRSSVLPRSPLAFYFTICSSARQYLIMILRSCSWSFSNVWFARDGALQGLSILKYSVESPWLDIPVIVVKIKVTGKNGCRFAFWFAWSNKM